MIHERALDPVLARNFDRFSQSSSSMDAQTARVESHPKLHLKVMPNTAPALVKSVIERQPHTAMKTDTTPPYHRKVPTPRNGTTSKNSHKQLLSKEKSASRSRSK